ncbi:MAG TPA: hypothetical protein VM840_02405 [Actinomycetota bacterium]|nr:hypothetical protein [Actinomycetota bacterium]
MPDLSADLWSPATHWQRDRPNTYAVAAGLALFSVVMILFPLLALSEVDARTGVRVPLESVPQGVSIHAIGNSRVFLVRDAREMTGFRSVSPHLGSALWWCPDAGVFYGPAHGEIFGRDGRLLWGQSPVNMERFEVDVAGDEVLLRPEQPIPSTPAAPRAQAELPASVQALLASGTCANRLV